MHVQTVHTYAHSKHIHVRVQAEFYTGFRFEGGSRGKRALGVHIRVRVYLTASLLYTYVHVRTYV